MDDQINGAGAYKADRRDDFTTERRDFRRPFHLHLSKDRSIKLDGRAAAIAAGAFGLGYLAYRGIAALLDRRPASDDRLRPEPLVASAEPVKDNAAPRFVGEELSVSDDRPFVAASGRDDTTDFLVERTDRSADTAEHVPTDLLGDRPPSADDRAVDAFRPDPTAPVPDAMRDSLRPATGPAPGFAATRGSFASGVAQTDGSK